MSKAEIRVEKVTIPTYKLGEPEKSPLFIEKRAYQGSTGKVYPLPVTEKIYDFKEPKQYTAIILENEFLYVMILPEIGGRIQRAYDKTNGYDFVYYNRVIKPALVGLVGPWISGGIEFNWPQHHRPSTFMPVDYSISNNSDGSVTAYVGETDIMYGTKSVAGITLYPDKAYIEIKGRLYNPTDFPQTFLWWSNPAVSVNDSTYSVFPVDVNAVMDHGKRAVSTFPIATGEYYKVDYSSGVDISRYKNIPVPTSYMAAHSDYDFIGNFDESKDAGLLHIADHHISPGKKQWTWGNGDFGKMWDKNLTDEDGPYIELMTGVYTDNQPDFTWLKPNEEKTFTQYFMPYKTVGRVSNATKDIVIGIDGDILKIYSSGVFNNAQIVLSNGYKKTVDLTPYNCFKEKIDGLKDCAVSVIYKGKALCKYTQYKQKDVPVPNPAKAILPPKEIESLEELFLAGQHLEQYRHATRQPADYYLEGLRRDKTDIRLNNAYGLLLLRNGRISESIQYFKNAISKQTSLNPNPYHGEVFYNLATAYRLLGELDKAYDAYYKATWSAETQSGAFYHLACISNKKGDMQGALEFVENSLVKNYHNMKARALKAQLMTELGINNNSFLEESYNIDPLYFGILYQYCDESDFKKITGDKTQSYLRLSLDYMEFGFYKKAVSILNLCNNDSPLLEYFKGYACLALGKEQEGIEHFNKAEGKNSDYCFPNSIYEMLILRKAIDTAGELPMANYYLGNLLYDKKQYEKAIECWEKAGDFPIALRNLSIAYYNKLGNTDKALTAIKRACALSPNNSRFLLEQDQLFAKAGLPCDFRLNVMQEHKELLEERDVLCLAYIKLLNQNKKFEQALNLLKKHKFNVWEGGEGKVANEYKSALFGLAEIEMDRHNYDYAIELCKKTLVYPDNLGEGKLFNVPDNKAYYLIGLCCKNLGDKKNSVKYFTLATKGSIKPEAVRYYNDQPSDYIYYIGLAFIELNMENKARQAFKNLISFGKDNLNYPVEYDFFAVSMPELEVYQDDIQKRNDDYCKMLIELGEKGMSLL